MLTIYAQLNKIKVNLHIFSMSMKKWIFYEISCSNIFTPDFRCNTHGKMQLRKNRLKTNNFGCCVGYSFVSSINA